MQKKLEILNSNIDQSVNFVEEQLVGFLESRFVRKCDEYFICYLSSQTGCNRGCKFCHLTATGQTKYTDSTYYDFLSQATQVFQHYQNQLPAKYVHYNFMARGEVLANNIFLKDADRILWALGELAMSQNLSAKFNVSTIMPRSLTQGLTEIFKVIQPTIYYSLYSISEKFRRQWMPAAMQAGEALRLLKIYQDHSKKAIKIHYAFIKGENDSIDDLEGVCRYIDQFKLNVEFNLVRYNPASPAQGCESEHETIQRNIEFLQKNLNGKVQIIPRVGADVFASCGMFIQ